MRSYQKKRLTIILTVLFIILAFAVFLQGNASVGLFESSEARYAEVAREMTATGNYLSPQIDYVYHFTKPPVAYWLTALGYEVFGMNTFGARFFLAFAAILVLLITCRIFKLKTGSDTGVLAAVLLFFSLLFFSMGKVVTTDMYLTLWITAGFLLWTLREFEKISPRNFSLLFGITAALAFMTKGPVPFLFWLVVLVPYSIFETRGKSLKPFLSPWFWIPLLVLGTPWFIAVGIVHKGLLAYLLTKESAEAVYSAKRFHPGPWYYYIPILLAGFLPWWIIVAVKWKNVVEKKVRLWLLWAIVPILVWSFFPAKLPTYILPTMPAWALLAAWCVVNSEKRSRILWSIVPLTSGILGAAFIGYLLRKPSLPDPGTTILVLLGLSAFSGVAGAVYGAVTGSRKAVVAACASMLCILIALPVICIRLEDNIKIRRKLGMTIDRKIKPGDRVLEYRTTLFSIPFYIRGKVATFQNNFSRKKYLEKKMPEHILTSEADLERYLKESRSIWVVTEDSEEKNLLALLPEARLVMRQGHHSLWKNNGTNSSGREEAGTPPSD